MNSRRRVASPALCAALLVLPGPVGRIAEHASARPSQQGVVGVRGASNEQAKHKEPLLLNELFSKGLPRAIVSLDLKIYHEGDPSPEPKRLAVLRDDGLHIYRPERGKLIQEFFLDQPEGVPWDDMYTFPSLNHLFGLVLWASVEHSYAVATVVCYVGGAFKVVFQGRDINFADLDSDGIPELLAEHFASEDSTEAQWVDIWTWNGMEYVEAARVKPGELWSEQITEAVRRAKDPSRKK